MDLKNSLILGLSILLITLVITSNQRPAIPSQSIFQFQQTQPAEYILPTPQKTAIAFQSILFQATPEAIGNIITFKPGPSTITQILFGIPIYLWMIILGSVIIAIILQFVKPVIREIEEPNTLMNTINTGYIIIFVIGFLWIWLNLTNGRLDVYTLFYGVMYLGVLGVFAYLKSRFTFGFNIGINDKILYLWDVTDFTQIMLIPVGVIILLSLMNISQAPFASFSAGATTLLVVPIEDAMWINLPTYLGMAIGAGALAFLISQIKGRRFSLIDSVNDSPTFMFCGLWIILVLTAVFAGYWWSEYHQATYGTLAPIVAQRYGITEEQAKVFMIRSVSDFGSYGVFATALSGGQIPVDIVHFWTNWKSG